MHDRRNGAMLVTGLRNSGRNYGSIVAYRLRKDDMSLAVYRWESIKGVVEVTLRSQTRPP